MRLRQLKEPNGLPHHQLACLRLHCECRLDAQHASHTRAMTGAYLLVGCQHRLEAALSAHLGKHQAAHVDGEAGRGVVHRLVARLHRVVEHHGGDGPARGGEGLEGVDSISSAPGSSANRRVISETRMPEFGRDASMCTCKAAAHLTRPADAQHASEACLSALGLPAVPCTHRALPIRSLRMITIVTPAGPMFCTGAANAACLRSNTHALPCLPVQCTRTSAACLAWDDL